MTRGQICFYYYVKYIHLSRNMCVCVFLLSYKIIPKYRKCFVKFTSSFFTLSYLEICKISAIVSENCGLFSANVDQM